nr:hypothetical protein MarFTME_233 [Marseillevirus futianmevirus]
MFAVWIGTPSEKGVQFEKPDIRQVLSWFRAGGTLSFESLDNLFVSYRGENSKKQVLSVCERFPQESFGNLKLKATISDFREFASCFPESYKVLLSSK